MTELVYFVLIAHGLTQILVYGKIFDEIRPSSGWFGNLLSCPMCTGFWSGVFLWGTNNYTELFSYDLSLLSGFSLGCLSSGTSYMLSVVFDDDGFKISRRDK